MKTKTIIFTTITALVLASIAGCTLLTPGPAEVTEVTVCRDVDSEYKPIEPMNTFSSGTQMVYVSVKVDNITPDDKLTTRWNYLETNEEISVTDFTSEESGSGYIGFSLFIEEGFPSGRYNAVVFLNNELVETVEFMVE
jgi:hypothetical protein